MKNILEEAKFSKIVFFFAVEENKKEIKQINIFLASDSAQTMRNLLEEAKFPNIYLFFHKRKADEASDHFNSKIKYAKIITALEFVGKN